VAIWYVDPRIGVGEESDDWIGPFGIGKRRSSWAGVTLGNGQTAYGLGGHVGVVTNRIILDGTDRRIGSYGDGRHIIDARLFSDGGNQAPVTSNGTHGVVQDLVILGPISEPAAVSIHSLSSGFVMRRTEIIGAGQSATIANNAGFRSFTRNAFTLENCEISQTNVGIRMSPSGSILGLQLLRNLRLRDSSIAEPADSDGISCFGHVDCGYLLRLENIEVSGFSENGVDINVASNVIVDGLYVHDMIKVPGVANNALLLGNQALTAGGNIVRRVKARRVYDGIVFRGGVNNNVQAVDIQAENIALYQGLGAPTGNQVHDATLRGGSVALRTQAGADLLIRDSVLQSGLDSLGARVDAACGLNIGRCISNKTAFGGLGTVTDSGGNISNADLKLSADGRPLPGSLCLTEGSGDYRRDIRGLQSRGHIGAYGAARLRTI
jgi:hypothetical protein